VVTQDEILRAMMHGDDMSTTEIGTRLSMRRGFTATGQIKALRKKGLVQSRGKSEPTSPGHSPNTYRITEAGLKFIRSGKTKEA
jgi:chromosome segregation and condensation protein ScpB